MLGTKSRPVQDEDGRGSETSINHLTEIECLNKRNFRQQRRMGDVIYISLHGAHSCQSLTHARTRATDRTPRSGCATGLSGPHCKLQPRRQGNPKPKPNPKPKNPPHSNFDFFDRTFFCDVHVKGGQLPLGVRLRVPAATPNRNFCQKQKRRPLSVSSFCKCQIDSRTCSTRTGYTHRGGTGLQEPSRRYPAVAGNGQPRPASSQHSGPSRLHRRVWWSTLKRGSCPAPCRCCPAGSVPPGGDS